MGINDFYDLLNEKEIFEIQEYMIKRGWNSKEEFISTNGRKTLTFSFFNDLFSFSQTIHDFSKKKEIVIQIAAECLYYDLKLNFFSS